LVKQLPNLFDFIEIQDFSVHPRSDRAVCSVNRGNDWELALLSLKTGRLQTMRRENRSLRWPVYSEDGGLVAFGADNQGDENHDVFTVRSDFTHKKRLTEGGADNSHPEFSPDGKTMAFTSNREKDMENLYLVPTRGGRIRKLTNENWPVNSFAWSHDGRMIAYATGVGHENYTSIADVGRGKTRKVLSKRGVEYDLPSEFESTLNHWSVDGKRILFTSNENDSADIGELEISSGRTRWLVRSRNDKYSPQWSPDGQSLIYFEVDDPNIVLKIKTGQRTQTISPKEGVSRSATWLPDGSGLVFINGTSCRPEEMFLKRTGKPIRISRFLRKAYPKGSLVRPKPVIYKSFDGERIGALLFVPRDRSRKAGIVMPHGGPEMQTRDAWDQLPQMLASKGFVVLEPNYRGSAGHGRRFLHLHDKDMGGGDLKDTLMAGRHLLDSGLVADGRLGFWGASYGGFLCMLALTKDPALWAAGVSIVGFFDWETEMATERGFLKAYDAIKMGDPKKDPAFFRERSPIYFLDRLKAPLLMTASAQDVRCPPTESRAVVKKLGKLGKKVEYHEYKDEGHWPRKRKNLRDLYERSTRFLDENIPR
jgi:dipeptidyl aminopeptidase/acylaminoacyl peptidase